MPEYTKIIRKMRVFEFEVEMSENERRCVFVIDREDDLSTKMEVELGVAPISEFRVRNIGLALSGKRDAIVLTSADNAGYASTEIMRILNQTGFNGELLFLTLGNTYPLHLMRRLNKQALDFDLDTISMANLLLKVNKPIQTVPCKITHVEEISSAMG